MTKKTEPATETGTDIIATVTANPVTVLTNEKTYSEFYAKMKAETDAFVPDISTVKGRGEIAALAYKVTRTKTAIDAAGKKLNEEARKQINAVDANRRKIWDELETLANTVRKPLTEWEEAEEARKYRINEILDCIRDWGTIRPDDNSDEIKRRASNIRQLQIFPDVFAERMDEATDARQSALDRLDDACDRALKAEADAAELARLRAEAEAREIAERERAAAEQAAQAERERVEREKAAAAKREQEQKDREARAVETARQDAIRKANEAHAAELAKIEAENRRLADAERARVEAEERTKREELARQADRKHRGEIMGAAKTAMMELGATEEVAKKIVLAIVAGEIPAVSLRF